MKQAFKVYQQSKIFATENAVHKQLLEDTTPKYVSMLVTMSQMLQDTGNLDEASGYLKDALQKLSMSSSPQNLLRSMIVYAIGTFYDKLEAQTTKSTIFVDGPRIWYYTYEAYKQMNTALKIMRKVCNRHPNTATILAALGRLDMDIGYFNAARLHLEEALDIQTACCGPVHPNIAVYHQALAGVTRQIGDELSTKSHSQEAQKIYRTLIKREGELSARACIKMPILRKWQENAWKL